MILDADMTVPPEDLPSFHRPLREGLADFINGTRLIFIHGHWGHEAAELRRQQALRRAGELADGHPHLSDTLCGTKAFFREDYRHFSMGYDPWGDFDYLFGGAQLSSKVRRVPVHYQEAACRPVQDEGPPSYPGPVRACGRGSGGGHAGLAGDRPR